MGIKKVGLSILSIFLIFLIVMSSIIGFFDVFVFAQDDGAQGSSGKIVEKEKMLVALSVPSAPGPAPGPAPAPAPNPDPILASEPLLVSSPDSFLKDVQKVEVDLFSGAASYNYPLWVPQGRAEITPKLGLSYSSNMRQFDSIVGYGWSLPTNAIFRSTERGTNHLYSDNDFTADIWGNTTELIVTNTGLGEYSSKIESDFQKYVFNNNSWIVTDKFGTKYYFGQNSASRQEDPANANHVYKWLLSRVEDMNGNYMTFSYFEDAGQIYPSNIRYTGYGNDPGIYEIQFERRARTSYTNYERGFKTTTRYLISRIKVIYYNSGSPELIRSYDLDHTVENVAVVYLSEITVKNGASSLPSINFSYFDKTNSIDHKAINLLKRIDYPYGAKEYLYYKSSTAYRLGAGLANSKLPFVVHTLYQKKLKPDPGGSMYTTEYKYTGGHYYYDNLDAFKKQYAGFHEVEIIDPVGNVQKLFFHQSEFSPDNAQSRAKGEFADHISKRGRIYRYEQYDDSGNLYETVINKWDRQQLPDMDPNEERNFIFLSRETSVSYDGNQNKRVRAKEMTYDSYGNIHTLKDYGQVNFGDDSGNFSDVGNDKIDITKTYINNGPLHIHGLLNRQIKTNASTVVIGDEKYFYDSLPFNQATKGNLTRIDKLINAPSSYVREEMAYNSYGLPIQKTNARGYSENIDYDSYNLYPARITNSKGHVVTLTCHYLSGRRASATDPNGAKVVNEYDVFGRLDRTRVSNPDSPSVLLLQDDYSYAMSSWPISITKDSYAYHNDVNGNAVVVTQKTYYDGLGRSIQVLQEAEGGNQFIVVNSIYDSRGNLAKETLPITVAGIGFRAPASNAIGTTCTYDALNRQKRVTNSLGTTSIVYDVWEKRVTDPNGKKKDFINNARDNLVGVKEYWRGTPYLTSYTYNGNNNLIKIKDTKGNERSITYDLLGRQLRNEDLHTSNDGTFGVWNYVYDENGNITQTTDPENQVVQFTYDELDRILTQDSTSRNGVEVNYIYDQGQYGIGRLSEVNVAVGTYYDYSPEVIENYTYDLLGRVEDEEIVIDGRSFETKFEYDLTGKVERIGYPDGFEVLYKVNNVNWIEKIQRKEAGRVRDVITNIDYSPHGKMVSVQNANGVVTTDVFDINRLYRLTHKETVYNGNKIQDLDYTYDAVGNLTRLEDNSQTDTAKTSVFSYDDLYRLVQAVVTGAANGQNYVRTYFYNILGNITNRSDVGTYTYAGGNFGTSNAVFTNPHAVTQAGTQQFSYDRNGNLVSDGTWNYNYNFQDYLVDSDDGQKNIKYLYNSEGGRVYKRNMITNKKTYYANKYYDVESGVIKRHIFINDLKVATALKKP